VSIATAPTSDDLTVSDPLTAKEPLAGELEFSETPSQGISVKEAKPPEALLDEALGFVQLSQEFWQKGELENALEALDLAYSLVLKIDEEDRPKLIQQKEDLRFLISKRILEIYASRHIVVNGHHNAIPIDINSHVTAEINSFTRGAERKFFDSAYRRSGRYRPMIEAKLKEAGLPLELAWLPLIESGYKVNALSKARALGLWQFIPSTGYKFGLKRNRYIDERLDPIKATDAAIAYLKELHQMFGDWTTVLAAYNCGEGRVLRVIRSQNVNYLDNFWDLYQRLPRETARYVPRFLATLHIMNNRSQYGLENLTLDPSMEFASANVTRQLHLKHVAQALGESEQTLRALNPELRYRVTPGDPYPLRIPKLKESVFAAKASQIPTYRPPQQTYAYHHIRKGQSISTIARRYGVSVQSIARANGLRKPYRIIAGKRLKIPQKGQVVYASQQISTDGDGKIITHVVKRGDSLWNLARRYGTTTREIQQRNGLRNSNLSIGQQLSIPDKKTASTKPQLQKYRVRKGDTAYKIALSHNMSLKRFLRINQISSRTKIYPGQKLYVE
jgi:membrane-bound lytic murein transglycosylase D